MKNLIKNLQAVNRNLTALSKKVDKIIVQVGKLEKPKSAKKTTAKAKPVKKVVIKQTAKLSGLPGLACMLRHKSLDNM